VDDRAARDVWASFQHDPRDPAVASLRASDADRNVVHCILTEAFADGRLDREEYDERTSEAMRARTLGELPPLVNDLVPDRPLLPARVPLAAASAAELRRRAEEEWRQDRRGAFLGFLGSAVVTWAIFIAVNASEFLDWNDHFPWPLIVNAVAFMNFVRVAANRGELVAEEVKRLERKQAKAIESQRKKQSGP
jgi:hypothetical protein